MFTNSRTYKASLTKRAQFLLGNPWPLLRSDNNAIPNYKFYLFFCKAHGRAKDRKLSRSSRFGYVSQFKMVKGEAQLKFI